MAPLHGVTRAAIVLVPGTVPWRGRVTRVLVTVLIAGVLSAPIRAQTVPRADASQAPQEPGGAPVSSPGSLNRIGRALALERTVDLPDGVGLGLGDQLRLVERPPPIELFHGLEFVAGIDLFGGADEPGGPVPQGGPTHRAMLNSMTPREFSEAAYSDVLGMTTASAFAVVPAAIKKFAGWLMGGDDSDGPNVPMLTETEEAAALASVRADGDVLDADITQRGRTVALSLVVPAGTPPATARALGERFVLVVKTLALVEPEPGEEIGAGEFDYVVDVSTPTETVIATGGKATSATSINW
jgi:hypothetical protein